ncbi:hypothetical protein KR222_010563 [Zaprionus bogoriensis]|nr:hypothetical protein KR222_010563 [Zaprionus bogoriensis]
MELHGRYERLKRSKKSPPRNSTLRQRQTLAEVEEEEATATAKQTADLKK